MDDMTALVAGICEFRPFLPAKDYPASLRFYEALGFESSAIGETMAQLSLGTHTFLLQGYYVKEWADNMMMHVLVEDVQAWWRHVDSLDLASRFDVKAPVPPRAEPWGLTVAYVFDPSGVLWHFAQPTEEGGPT